MSNSQGSEFQGWRKYIWPIHSYELKKVLPMAFIMFAILFNYTLLRDTKDTIVVNAAKGSSTIPTIKLWFVTPFSILFIMAYVKLSSVMSREKLFYVSLSPLIAYFVLYAYVIYPNLDYVHPTAETIDAWRAATPGFLLGFLDKFYVVFQFWAHSLFYILAEIWGSVGISLLFWQFANEITETKEAKRVYVFYGFIANASLIFSGQVVRYFSDIKDKVAPGVDPWQVSLNYLMGAVLLFGVMAMVLYRWLNTSVLTDPRFAPPVKEKKKKKEKPGLGESIKIILSNPYLMLIAVLVMAYGITINLVEVLWKDQLGKQYTIKNDYNAFMGNFSTITGVFAMFFMIAGGIILRAVSWFKAAFITPAFILGAGVLFFCFVLFKETMAPLVEGLNTTPLYAAVILGALLVILSKAVKYALFDPTKEMAYIPLDDDLKAKGKAVVDVVGGRAGKAGGAGIQFILFGILSTNVALDIAPYSLVIFAVIAVAWIYAVKALSPRVDAAVKARDAEKKTA